MNAPPAPRMGEYVKAHLPGHDEPQACVVRRRYTADGTYRLLAEDGQTYDGIPLSDIVPETIAPAETFEDTYLNVMSGGLDA